VRLPREIAARQPLADLLGGESQPGEQVEDERLRAWIRRSLGTAFHIRGNTPLAPAQLPEGNAIAV
jgi:hypothetical protein